MDRNTFADRWERIAGAIPGEVVIRQGNRTLTWRQWDERSNRLARALLELGVERQDKVAIMEYNSCEYMEALFAAFKIAACPVNVNYRYYSHELEYIIENSDARVLVLNADFIDRVERIRDSLTNVEHFIVIGNGGAPGMLRYEGLLKEQPATRPRFSWAPPAGDDILFLYTGGTTGIPKGVMWRQEDCVLGMIDVLVQGITDNTKRIADAPVLISESRLWDNRLNRWLLKRDLVEKYSGKVLKALFNRPHLSASLVKGRLKCVVCAPLMHGTAVVGAFTVLMLGGSIVLLTGKRFSAEELWQTVEELGRSAKRTEVLGILIVGDAFALPMVEELERKKYDTDAVNLIFSSGVLWSPEMKKSMLDHIPQAILQDVLGATEGLTTGYATTSAHKEIPKATFRVKPDGPVPVRVIDEETGRDVRPGSGEVGVMAVGGHVPVGYWKDPEKTARVFRVIDGRRYNVFGDMCTVDAEGFIQFLGRGSEVINSGGEKVYPQEVEECVADHPAVIDVGVVGTPHPRWGEAVTAVVVLGDGEQAAGEEITRFCRGKIADYKIPRRVVFVSSLNRMPSGKKEYRKIREIAVAELEEAAVPEKRA